MSDPRLILVTRAVKITLDESHFTEAWMAHFSSYMYSITEIGQVYEDLGRLYVDGVIDEGTDDIEGYGDPKVFKLKFILDDETFGFNDVSDETHV